MDNNHDNMQQKLWTEVEQLCSQAIQQGLFKERRAMLFMKVKDVKSYLSAVDEFISAHIQCGVNSDDQLEIYYLYLLQKPSPGAPNLYRYFYIIQQDPSQIPELNEAFFEIDVTQGVCKHLPDKASTFDGHAAYDFLATKVLDYFKQCQLTPNPSAPQKIIDDFVDKNSPK